MVRANEKYDVALSFAGEDRVYAEALADALVERGVNVFYDRYEKTTLWGKDLYTYLSDLYQNQAHYCIMFLSKYYASKLWTNHERRSAQARSFQENDEYILPIRLDDTEIPGILPTVGYLTWQNETPATIADAIVAKVNHIDPIQTDTKKIAKSNLNHPVNWNMLYPFYCQSFDGKTENVWIPYQDDIWSATIEDGVYKLSNNSDPIAVRYKYFQINEQDMSEVGISVDIKSASDKTEPLSGAGIIYRFNRETKDYYAFTIREDKYSFYKRQNGSYKPLFSGRIHISKSDGFNNLSIVGKKNIFGLYINNTFLRTIEDSELNKGDIGIIAMGKGIFYFDNLAVYLIG